MKSGFEYYYINSCPVKYSASQSHHRLLPTRISSHFPDLLITFDSKYNPFKCRFWITKTTDRKERFESLSQPTRNLQTSKLRILENIKFFI
jgi:hypothetical protein